MAVYHQQEQLMRDTLEATLGTTFRTGLGLAKTLDNIVEDFPSLFEEDAGGKGVEASAELVANLVNTFLYQHLQCETCTHSLTEMAGVYQKHVMVSLIS